MELTTYQVLKLSFLGRGLKDMTLEELAKLYKETAQTYLSLQFGDIAEERFYSQMKQLQEYGNLLTYSKCENEDDMMYEVTVDARNSHIRAMTQADKEQVVKEIGKACYANVSKPVLGKRLFSDVMFILPYVYPANATKHDLVKEFLKEYGLTYRRVVPQFSFAIT